VRKTFLPSAARNGYSYVLAFLTSGFTSAQNKLPGPDARIDSI
jgi:hypothetical protein